MSGALCAPTAKCTCHLRADTSKLVWALMRRSRNASYLAPIARRWQSSLARCVEMALVSLAVGLSSSMGRSPMEGVGIHGASAMWLIVLLLSSRV